MSELITKYRRNLPHIQTDNCVLFITYRLAFSLPKQFISDYQEIKKKKNKQSDFEYYDEFIGSYSDSPKFLNDDKVAEIVKECFHFWHNKRYELICYCIMPNHIHILIKPLQDEEGRYYLLNKIVYTWKSFTAKKINLVIGKSGKIWCDEHYDHVIRTEEEFRNTVLYVMNNPVKASLCGEVTEWKHSYLNRVYGSVSGEE